VGGQRLAGLRERIVLGRPEIRFDGATPADEVVAGLDLRGRLAVITGASAGIGRETARVLAAAGADLVVGARRLDALDDLEAELRAAGIAGELVRARLDLTDDQSIDAFADTVLERGGAVDILINNAGIMACPLQRDARGHEIQFRTNALGHALLLSRLATALRAGGSGRFVSLTSLAHQRADVDFDDIHFERRPYDPWVAYGQSKTACALLAVKAQHALGEAGVCAFAVHPGVIPSTELQKHLSPDDLARAIARSKTSASAYKTIASGAATSVWAATAPDLAGWGPLYLEDCGIARIIPESNGVSGVRSYALDAAGADRLWRSAEQMLGRDLPL
jgi:NAD(P)-dependent dehydrogenase (short-subunit alcohol dehydrogenase family)